MDVKVGDYVKIISGPHQYVGSGSVVSLVPSRKSIRISAGFINILVKVKDVKVKEFFLAPKQTGGLNFSVLDTIVSGTKLTKEKRCSRSEVFVSTDS